LSLVVAVRDTESAVEVAVAEFYLGHFLVQ
jgi:hypothetical protein